MKHYCYKILLSFSWLGLTNLVCLANPQIALANPVELQAFFIERPTIVPDAMLLGKFLLCQLLSQGRSTLIAFLKNGQ
jgi:hypothetical protein